MNPVVVVPSEVNNFVKRTITEVTILSILKTLRLTQRINAGSCLTRSQQNCSGIV